VALSLFGLIAVGGIAFDYARMATLDTELQAAADQAALAAATQLDGKANACSRAGAAATNLVGNRTLFANETGGNRSVTVDAETACDQTGDVKFYKTKTRTIATTDADAKFVEVTVNSREAFFALTPIVAALRSGAISATAFAGLGSAICKVPPLMMCNPKEGSDSAFTTSNYIGKGILLVARQNQADAYGPGNFGFLDTGYDATGGGTAVLRRALGQENFVANCSPTDGVTTEPGAPSPAMDAINRRFDILSANTNQNDTCGSGQCPPSTNTRKDLVKQGNGNNSCTLGAGGSPGWKEPSSGKYLPTSPTIDLSSSVTLSPMGHPRDKCHAFDPTTGCTSLTGNSRVGNGDWDRAAYFRSNFGASYNWQSAMNAEYGTTAVTRYQVYKWELKTANRTINPGGISVSRSVAPGTSYGAPICEPPGREPSGDFDRRVLTVAVINCGAESIQGGVNGKKSNVGVTKWIDVFLVEPSVARTRTTANDLYVEVIKERDIGSNATTGGTVRRDVPYLIE
jgi:Flp pilus assembly protein TadG